ncbi:MAG: ABC transporter ATP-binding protein [Acidobacteriota bacterium]
MSGLRTEGLSFAYGDDAVLSEVDLVAEAGEVTAIVGPNGVGKTTLLRLLAGLLAPDRGQIQIGEQEVDRASRRRLARRIALAPQLEKPAWPLTVSQMVALGRAPHVGWWRSYSPADREVVERVLEQVGLSTLADRLITELSGGEYSRAVLARTLAQEPRVLLLDEPTAHLDLKHQAEVLRRLRQLAHEDGLTVVVTLHDLNQAATTADRVALLQSSSLRASGPPEEVLTREHLEPTYGVAVSVVPHPETGVPWIMPR